MVMWAYLHQLSVLLKHVWAGAGTCKDQGVNSHESFG